MPSSLPSSHFRVTVLLCGLALGLGFISPEQVSRLRMHLLDVLKPGLDGLMAAETRWQAVREECPIAWPRFESNESRAEADRLAAELESWRERCRRLEIDNAALNRRMEQLKTLGPSPYPTRPGKPLVNVEVLEAVVLNRDSKTIWPADRIVNLGEEAGLSESDLVLAGQGALIDQGEQADLAAGHPVYAGRAVVGRLANVGRTVSTIQRVTDADYRGFAQLIRKTEAGFVFGAEGVLEGQGRDLCLLRYVPGTEAVETGDEVYTGDSEPYPMYYGRVIRAARSPSVRSRAGDGSRRPPREGRSRSSVPGSARGR